MRFEDAVEYMHVMKRHLSLALLAIKKDVCFCLSSAFQDIWYVPHVRPNEQAGRPCAQNTQHSFKF
jgi:hypothetical protein